MIVQRHYHWPRRRGRFHRKRTPPDNQPQTHLDRCSHRVDNNSLPRNLFNSNFSINFELGRKTGVSREFPVSTKWSFLTLPAQSLPCENKTVTDMTTFETVLFLTVFYFTLNHNRYTQNIRFIRSMKVEISYNFIGPKNFN